MKKKVMVADDEKASRELIAEMLGRNYKIIEVLDGAELVEVAVKESPDIIITDVVMPIESGYEAVSRLKKIDKFRDTPVIFISGRMGKDGIHNILKPPGPTAFVEKPLKYDEIKKIIEELLKQKGDKQQAARTAADISDKNCGH